MRPISVFTPSTTVSETACIPQSHKPPPPVIPQEIAEELWTIAFTASLIYCSQLLAPFMHALHPSPPTNSGIRGGAAGPRPRCVEAQAVLAWLACRTQYKEGKNKNEKYIPLCAIPFITDAARCILQSLFSLMFPFSPMPRCHR